MEKKCLIEYEYKLHVNDSYCNGKILEPYGTNGKIVQVFECCEFAKKRFGSSYNGNYNIHVYDEPVELRLFTYYGGDNDYDTDDVYGINFCPSCGAKIDLVCVKKTEVQHKRISKKVLKEVEQCVDEPTEKVVLNLR